MSKLFVNIDHVATLREARKTEDPSILQALYECELAGVDGVTIHLREDQRHIKYEDVIDIKKHKKIIMNLESSLDNNIVDIVCKTKPEITCIVPEKRQEITTEGGLDIIKYKSSIFHIIERYHQNNIEVSLFINPDMTIIDKAKELKSDSVEIHTGYYSNSSYLEKEKEAKKILDAVEYAFNIGLKVNIGHGLNYNNVKPFLNNKMISEFNIGHSIIARSIFIGLRNAIIEMKNLIET